MLGRWIVDGHILRGASDKGEIASEWTESERKNFKYFTVNKIRTVGELNLRPSLIRRYAFIYMIKALVYLLV